MESFGARLKQQREQRKITLDEIAQSTKIGTRFLRALEEEHFDQLPGGIFNKGFIRAYARVLGLDEEQAVADYLSATGDTTAARKVEIADFAQPLESRAEAGAAQLPWGIFAVVLLVVALGFALWGFYTRDKQSRSVVHTESVPSSSVSLGNSATPAFAGTTTQPAVHPASSPSESSTVPSASANVSPSPASAGSFTVSIHLRDDSWISIVADGKPVLQDTLISGTQKTFSAQKEIVVKAGNIGAIDFSFNGEKLPPQGEVSEVKTLTFDAKGLQPATPKVDTLDSQPPNPHP